MYQQYFQNPVSLKIVRLQNHLVKDENKHISHSLYFKKGPTDGSHGWGLH